MYDYPGPLAVLVDALKKKSVRFDELSFKHGEFTCLENNVMVLRGDAYEFVHRTFERRPCSIARTQPALAFISRKLRKGLAPLHGVYVTTKLFVAGRWDVHKRVTQPIYSYMNKCRYAFNKQTAIDAISSRDLPEQACNN